MAKPIKTPVNPADCCKIPNCRKMLCGLINAYFERMTGCAVIETEVGEERTKFANTSIPHMRTFAQSLHASCGDETTQPFIDAMKGNYACHTPSACKPAPRGRYDNCGC